MKNVLNAIKIAKKENRKQLAILIDPDKTTIEKAKELVAKIKQSPATHLFVGGSSYSGNHLDELITLLKKELDLPILLFPGNVAQISTQADALLFLMLISGRNSEYLIEQQVNAVPILKKSNLEVISTGYLLIESGTQTAVEKVSQTKPLARNAVQYVAQTAQAGEYIGNKLIYLEAGSGANQAVPLEMIRLVAQSISIPLLVGGGIRSQKAIEDAFQAGADMVVIGTAFENDMNFFDQDVKILW